MEKKQLIRPMTFQRLDTCPVCRKEKAIDAYNSFKKGMGYSSAIDLNIDMEKWGIDISYFRCHACGRTFFPRWQDGKVMPMEDLNQEDFMKLYMYNKKM